MPNPTSVKFPECALCSFQPLQPFVCEPQGGAYALARPIFFDDKMDVVTKLVRTIFSVLWFGLTKRHPERLQNTQTHLLTVRENANQANHMNRKRDVLGPSLRTRLKSSQRGPGQSPIAKMIGSLIPSTRARSIKHDPKP